MMRLLFISFLNVALLVQGNPVSLEKDRCGFQIPTTQKPDVTTTKSYKLDLFDCPVPGFFDPLSKWKPLWIPYY